MARFRHDEVDHYGGQGGAGYFALKEDKEVATVRFMYNSVDDIEGYSVHQVELEGGRKVYVNCLREYNDPIDACPFCKAHYFQQAKLFIPLYNEDTGRVQIWERGKKFFGKLTSICSRYSNLVSHTFEIERNGKPRSTDTTYEIYETGKDNTTLEDLPELPKVLGSIVLDKNAEEMQYFLDHNEFPDATEEPIRRREVKEEPVEERRSGRRTPATRGDRF